MPIARQTEYETIYILRPSLTEEDRQKAKDRVEGILAEFGGTTLRFDDWGSRRLSYRIRDQYENRYHDQGLYQYMRYLAPRQTVAEIERNLRIMEPVLKYMTVKIEAALIPEERMARTETEEE
ncbi:MAG: 30S ribosomal protein S6 [Myxococcota bacterium]